MISIESILKAESAESLSAPILIPDFDFHFITHFDVHIFPSKVQRTFRGRIGMISLYIGPIHATNFV